VKAIDLHHHTPLGSKILPAQNNSCLAAGLSNDCQEASLCHSTIGEMFGEKTKISHLEEAWDHDDPGHAPELYRQDETILLDIGAFKSEGIATQLKIASDRHVKLPLGTLHVNYLPPMQTVYVPQPSGDPKDPVN
jgi:hypothetical protein